MGSTIFKQYDRRWAYTGYAGDTMWESGCGPSAMADIIHAKDTGITPRIVADWLANHGYASNGSGTYWSGIKAGLEAFGFPTVWHDTMQQMFNELAKGDRWGILLFRGGSRGGVTWTIGGHFVAVRDYKYQNGEHMLMIGDPGGRNHDGWYSYERHMQGLIIHCWTCYLPGWKPGKSGKPLSSVSTPQGNAVTEPMLYVTAKEGLNVRSGPGTNYSRIGGEPYGTPIKPVRRSVNWVYSRGAGGWLCSDYLAPRGGSSSSGYSVGRYRVADSMGLNVRTGPGVGYSKVTALINGTPLLILKVSGAWGYSRGAGGWVCLDYCKKR